MFLTWNYFHANFPDFYINMKGKFISYLVITKKDHISKFLKDLEDFIIFIILFIFYLYCNFINI